MFLERHSNEVYVDFFLSLVFIFVYLHISNQVEIKHHFSFFFKPFVLLASFRDWEREGTHVWWHSVSWVHLVLLKIKSKKNILHTHDTSVQSGAQRYINKKEEEKGAHSMLKGGEHIRTRLAYMQVFWGQGGHGGQLREEQWSRRGMVTVLRLACSSYQSALRLCR